MAKKLFQKRRLLLNRIAAETEAIILQFSKDLHQKLSVPTKASYQQKYQASSIVFGGEKRYGTIYLSIKAKKGRFIHTEVISGKIDHILIDENKKGTSDHLHTWDASDPSGYFDDVSLTDQISVVLMINDPEFEDETIKFMKEKFIPETSAFLKKEGIKKANVRCIYNFSKESKRTQMSETTTI